MMYSNFNQEVWYTPQSQVDEVRPTRFLLRTTPYRFISTATVASELSDIKNLSMSMEEFIISNCIIDFENVVSELPKEYILNNLTDTIGQKLTAELVNKVLELWVPNDEFLSIMVTTIELMIDPRFSDTTWHCKTCQDRGLDKQRNCPFLDKKEYHDPKYKLPFMGETVITCPVDNKDEQLGKVILEGHNFREINMLPESGGIGDQPILFILGTQHLAERIKHFEREANEKAVQAARNR